MEPNTATAFFKNISFIFNHVHVCEGVYDMVKASNVAAGNRKNEGPLNKAMGSCCSRNIVQGTCLILGVCFSRKELQCSEVAEHVLSMHKTLSLRLSSTQQEEILVMHF